MTEISPKLVPGPIPRKLDPKTSFAHKFTRVFGLGTRFTTGSNRKMTDPRVSDHRLSTSELENMLTGWILKK